MSIRCAGFAELLRACGRAGSTYLIKVQERLIWYGSLYRHFG